MLPRFRLDLRPFDDKTKHRGAKQIKVLYEYTYAQNNNTGPSTSLLYKTSMAHTQANCRGQKQRPVSTGQLYEIIRSFFLGDQRGSILSDGKDNNSKTRGNKYTCMQGMGTSNATL